MDNRTVLIQIPDSVDNFLIQLQALMMQKCSMFSIVKIYALRDSDFTHTIELERNAVRSFRSITIKFDPEIDEIIAVHLRSTNDNNEHEYVIRKANYVSDITNLSDHFLSILEIEFACKQYTKYKCAELKDLINKLETKIEEQDRKINFFIQSTQDERPPTNELPL
jgi:hypothetical protein